MIDRSVVHDVIFFQRVLSRPHQLYHRHHHQQQQQQHRLPVKHTAAVAEKLLIYGSRRLLRLCFVGRVHVVNRVETFANEWWFTG